MRATASELLHGRHRRAGEGAPNTPCLARQQQRGTAGRQGSVESIGVGWSLLEWDMELRHAGLPWHRCGKGRAARLRIH